MLTYCQDLKEVCKKGISKVILKPFLTHYKCRISFRIGLVISIYCCSLTGLTTKDLLALLSDYRHGNLYRLKSFHRIKVLLSYIVIITFLSLFVKTSKKFHLHRILSLTEETLFCSFFKLSMILACPLFAASIQEETYLLWTSYQSVRTCHVEKNNKIIK